MADAPLLLYTNPDTGELFRRTWRLVVADGDDRGTAVELTESPALIGAAPASSLVLTDDTVSRYHAEIDLFAEGLRVRDLDSTNGTFLEGENRIREGFVANGGTFRVGRTAVRVIAMDEPAASEIATDPTLLAPDGVVEIGPAVAASPLLHTLVDDVRRVAASSSAVLLRGERGSGKATIARALHDMSNRRRAPFVTVHAEALTIDRYQQMLFGEGTQIGLFTRAHHGTLFVEDVELLSPEAQSALRHTIDRREIQPLGSDQKMLRVDVRMVCSTTVDLREHPGFDPALSRRLAVVELRVPPLRDRPEDVLAIAARRLPPGFTVGPETSAFLNRQRWPNNGDDLTALLDDPLVATPPPLQAALLRDAVAAKHGDVSAVAAELSIGTKALFRKLADHDVDLDAL